MHAWVVLALLLLAPVALAQTEADTVPLEADFWDRHMPYGTLLDPIFETPESWTIVDYTHCGDSAIWTGHYLAAESFRYKVTRSPEALWNVKRTLRGIAGLIDVTGTGVLARCYFPTSSPYQASLRSQDPDRVFTGSLGGVPHYWIGVTSRDQYSGVFFGLGVAYDMVDDPGVRLQVKTQVTRLLDFLLRNNWAVVMPDGRVSTVFWGRADQQLSFLQVGRRVNPDRFSSAYKNHRFWYASSVVTPISWEVLDDHHSYYKFNLDYINLYNLIRLEDSSYYRWWYMQAYKVLRRTTDDHGNAHFNLVDRGLTGPNSVRDAAIREELRQWLQRPRTDPWVDWRGVYPACGEDRACQPIPVPDQVRTDFLWQRSPFLLYGGGAGTTEEPGIDYLLPYWMARYYGVL